MMLLGIILTISSTLSLTTGKLKAEFHIEEEQPSSWLVGNVASAVGLQSTTDPADFASLRYNLLDSPNHRGLFSVNKKNGNLYTEKQIDREKECGFKDACSIELKVAIFSATLSRFDVAEVSVAITDINDHSPVFPTEKSELNIPESSLVGSTYVIASATDTDSTSLLAVNGYRLLPENTPFRLNFSEEVDGRMTPFLYLHQPLDRENKEIYELIVVAFDGGKPENTGNLTVRVNILDENDNAPIFQKDSYDLSIAENTLIGTSLIRVSASDADNGDNGDVRYRFAARQPDVDVVSGYFEIDSKSGEIKLTKSIVYKTGELVNIIVEAIDNGQPARLGQTTIHVRIVDVGNNPPNVEINFLTSTELDGVSLLESSSVGTLVAFVAVQDLDTGDNGLVTCNVNDTSFALQTLEGKTGYLIATKESLDRETTDTYYIGITCRDHGTPEMLTSRSFTVKVKDVNDNKPKFSKDIYFASIMENNRISEYITKISATDADIGQNARIKYSIHTEAQGDVAIDAKTGVIKAIRRFDRETISQYNFTVFAIDGGSPAQTATATIVMKIDDQNDNAPVFKVPKFQFFVLENMASGIKIGKLSASDPDEGVNQNVLFTAVEGSLQKLPFAVYQDGTIRTTEPLDREVTQAYSFLVRAFDLGNPSLSSTAAVAVRVADDNDHVPVVTFPTEANKTIIIPVPKDRENPLMHIQAFDMDEPGPNSFLKYSIIDGNSDEIFEINSHSGALYLRASHDILQDEEFKLVISVQDGGYNPRATTRKVRFLLKRFNDTEPASLMETGSRNAIVITAVATLAIIAAATALTIVCIVRRNTQKVRSQKAMAIQRDTNAEELLKQKQFPASVKNTLSTGTSTGVTDKSKAKVSFADDEDLENMELYNSTGTSMFTDTLIESQVHIFLNIPKDLNTNM